MGEEADYCGMIYFGDEKIWRESEKIKSVIESCITTDQLYSAYRLIDFFITKNNITKQETYLSSRRLRRAFARQLDLMHK